MGRDYSAKGPTGLRGPLLVGLARTLAKRHKRPNIIAGHANTPPPPRPIYRVRIRRPS